MTLHRRFSTSQRAPQGAGVGRCLIRNRKADSAGNSTASRLFERITARHRRRSRRSSTTMAFCGSSCRSLLPRQGQSVKRIVPIIPDEARNPSAWKGMFPRASAIYSIVGQKYKPEDSDPAGVLTKQDIKGQNSRGRHHRGPGREWSSVDRSSDFHTRITARALVSVFSFSIRCSVFTAYCRSVLGLRVTCAGRRGISRRWPPPGPHNAQRRRASARGMATATSSAPTVPELPLRTTRRSLYELAVIVQ